MALQDYIIDHSSIDWAVVLCEWHWLLPSELTVWIMNRFGDLFVVLEDESVHMLDVGSGTFEKVAESRDDFRVKIDEDDNANIWLMIPLIDELVSNGMTLDKGKCYSYKQPPVVGGDYVIDNTCVLPILEHYGFYASFHCQIKDLPDGSQIVFKIVK